MKKTEDIKNHKLALSMMDPIKQRNLEENNSDVRLNGRSLLYLNLNGNVGVENDKSREFLRPALAFAAFREDRNGEEEDGREYNYQPDLDVQEDFVGASFV